MGTDGLRASGARWSVRGRMWPAAAGAVVLAAAVGIGCASNDRDKRLAKERWDATRGAVKASLASQQLSDGDIRAAEASIADAQRLSPENSALELVVAKVEIAKGNFARARDRLLAAAGASDMSAEAAYLLGVTYLAQGAWQAALERFERAMTLAPEDEEYLLAAVQACLEVDDISRARGMLAARVERAGWSPSLHAALAECDERTGRRSAAADNWVKATTGSTSSEAALRGRAAFALLRAQRLAEAGPLLREELASSDGAPDLAAQLALVDCLAAAGSLTEAEDLLGPIRSSHPTHPGVQRRVGLMLALRGRYSQALDALTPLIDGTTRDAGALELAAAIAVRAGDRAALTSLAQKLRAVCADSPVLARITGADQADSDR